MAQILRKPLILDGFQTEIRPHPGSVGKADGAFQPTPVLSKGDVCGRHRVLSQLPFVVLGCTNGGSAVGCGKGTIEAGQNVGTENGTPLHVHGDSGLCRGKLTPPTGTPLDCCCRVTLGSDDTAAAATDGRKAVRSGQLALVIRDRATKRAVPGVAVWAAGGQTRTHALTTSDGVRVRHLRPGRCRVGAGFEVIEFDRPRVLTAITGTGFVPVLLRTTRGTPDAPEWCLAEARAAQLSAGHGLTALAALAGGNRLTADQLARFNWASADIVQLNELFGKSGRRFSARDRGGRADIVLDAGEPLPVVVPRPFAPRSLATGTQELLVDVLDAPLAEWERLISFRPPVVVQAGLFRRGVIRVPRAELSDITYETDWAAHRVEAGVGDINLDYYPVRITKLPNGFATPEALLAHMRMNLNDFVDTGRALFEPIAPDDGVKLASANPVGGVVKVSMHMGPVKEYAAVVLSDLTPQRWVFSTVGTPGDDFSWDGGMHPVSGNREWGFQKAEGGYEFYIRGADRITSSVYLAPDALAKGAGWVARLNPVFDFILDYAPQLDPASLVKVPIAFQGGHNLWLGFQSRLAGFINKNGGAAEGLRPVSERHPWKDIQRVYHRPTGRWLDGRGEDVIVLDMPAFERVTKALRDQFAPLTADGPPNSNYVAPTLDLKTSWKVWKAIGCESYYVKDTAKGSYVVMRGYPGLRKFLRAPRYKDVLKRSKILVKEMSVAIGRKGLLLSALDTTKLTLVFIVIEDLSVFMYKQFIGKAFDEYDLAATLGVDIAGAIVSSFIGYLASLMVLSGTSAGAVVGFVPILVGIGVGFVVSVVIGAITDLTGLKALVASAYREAFQGQSLPTGWAPLPPDGYAEKLMRYNGTP